jgi:hypothetical protein
LLRLLAFRGLPEDQKLRAQVWKAMSVGRGEEIWFAVGKTMGH